MAGRPQPEGPALQLGVETLLNERLDWLRGQRVGLVTNPTGVDSTLRSTVDLLIAAQDEGGFEVTALYGPEHGVRGGVPAGAYVPSYTDERTGLPVYSLYGPTRKPSPQMLSDVDVLLFDIQDVGARFYTYISTLSYVMEAAAENDKQVIVLDRPNPLGDRLEGPVLEPERSSFVGLHPIPLRHGMTVGELARLFNGEYLDTPADLRVAEMRGYQPARVITTYDQEWVLPSPNIPTRETAFVYPGTGLVESLNISEGRGTTKPFEWVGAGFVDGPEAADLADDLNGRGLPGVTFRAMFATPTASKQLGAFSGGVELHVLDPAGYQAVRTGLHVLDAFRDRFPETDWREGSGCRTQAQTCWIDTLSGTKTVRAQLEADTDPDDIVAGWNDDLAAFADTARPYRIYR
ncbi:MAG: DUF1343 domain-containing protein [Euzebyales bacterium]|nr:DUF1343 domain-containing protein [Euzebyales bacterium]MBA3621274.1 DUF1343 domain-containing protein [Euzebyales bacterium]